MSRHEIQAHYFPPPWAGAGACDPANRDLRPARAGQRGAHLTATMAHGRVSAGVSSGRLLSAVRAGHVAGQRKPRYPGIPGIRRNPPPGPRRRGHFTSVKTKAKCPRLPGKTRGTRLTPRNSPTGHGRVCAGVSSGRFFAMARTKLNLQPFPAPAHPAFPAFSDIRDNPRSWLQAPGAHRVRNNHPTVPPVLGKIVRDPPHSTRNASMAHRCCLARAGNRNDGPSLLSE